MSSTQEAGDIFGNGKGPAQGMLRSPTVLIVSVGLWGMNVFFFQLFGINFKYVLQHDLLLEKKQKERSTKGKRRKEKEPHHQRQTSDDVLSIESSDKSVDEETASLLKDHTSEEQSGAAITWYKLVAFSISLLFVLHFTTHFWMDHLGRSSIGAVFSFYGAVMLYILLPLPSTKWLRRSFVLVMQRTLELFHPRCNRQGKLRPIPFIDVFYADAMCSLSKVFFDWGMLGHMAAHYPQPVPASTHNIIIPSVCAAVPYLIRARQCWVMLTIGRRKNDPKRNQHLANAIKYSTSIWPLILSAYQKTIAKDRADSLEGLLIFLLIVNASYSLYWDIVMDWGMMNNPTAVVQNACVGGVAYSDWEQGSPSKQTMGLSSSPNSSSCHHALLRPKLRYGVTISSWIFLTDCILRFSWTLRFFASHLFPNDDAFVLFTQFLEVFRRSIWNLLRVEWENLKQKNSGTRLIDDEDDEERVEPLELQGLIRQRVIDPNSSFDYEKKSKE